MDVLVFGLGRSGRKILDYFQGQANLFVYDDNPYDLEEIRQAHGDVKAYDASRTYDLLALSPGPMPDHPLIVDFKEKEIPVIGEMGLALENIKGQVLIVSGTNGKTTTTSLLHQMIKKKNPRTFVGGNIGIPLIGYVRDSRDEDAYVVEVSSFQLDSLGKISPSISALLNITPDHVAWHGSMDEYVLAKMELWKQNTGKQKKIINADDGFLIEESKKHFGSLEDFYFFSTKTSLDRGAYYEDGKLYLALESKEELLSSQEMKLKGEHNIANALAASLMARLYGVSLEDIRQVLRDFESLEHRYEILEEKKSRRFINDSKATNVDSSLPALRSASRPTVLIAGGQDKKISLEPLFDDFNPAIKEMIIFGEVKDQLYQLAQDHVSAHLVDNLDQAFDLAMELSDEGWDILFSPACASLDMYEDFEKRGEHFKELLRRL